MVVDGEVVEDAPVDGELWGHYPFDWSTPHEWSVVVDAPDDALDWSDGGTTEPCTTDPNVWTADVPVPAATGALSYTVTSDGILATTTPGHELGFTLTDPTGASYERIDDTSALLPWYAVVQPRCPLEGASVVGVCVEGQPYVDVAATQPEGASGEELEIEWTGNDVGYEVVYGSGGFGGPFTTRVPWPFVVHDDGTVSPTCDTDWRLEDVDVHLTASVWVTDGYVRSYHAMVEDAPVVDPCAEPGTPASRAGTSARGRVRAGDGRATRRTRARAGSSACRATPTTRSSST
ncbi:hypothetical protein [Isoptericola variabilis]|uniref:Uncharacterized protein n=1 Tax=Isoptericola variabilis (strain 225) TaxID=743718 RepID=F6FQ71_ISOV2|nr:hypothetical protein [Isoptericola variabilis]AEG42824.1 hypothetical protein Isova_0006 [Isoptericola variabilis 225]TWH33744.1 hypothetical protein L600_001600000130 [Isoptericola variabilis J7]